MSQFVFPHALIHLPTQYLKGITETIKPDALTHLNTFSKILNNSDNSPIHQSNPYSLN
jgi:hypothetical protein